jgi:hypothetical protein
MDNIISFEQKKLLKERMKEVMPTDSAYVMVVIPTNAEKHGGHAFVEFDERINEYMAIGMLEFGKMLILESANEVQDDQ